MFMLGYIMWYLGYVLMFSNVCVCMCVLHLIITCTRYEKDNEV